MSHKEGGNNNAYDNKRGAYQQKRGGGVSYGTGGHGTQKNDQRNVDSARGNQANQSLQYVKKQNAPTQQPDQEAIRETHN